MALPPRFASHRLGSPTAKHTLEFFWDFTVWEGVSRGGNSSPRRVIPMMDRQTRPCRLHNFTSSPTQCPHSARSFHRVYTELWPTLNSSSGSPLPSTEILFRHQVQPWHPQSTMCHEAALAVEQLAPDLFWPYAQKLFASSSESFYDAQTYKLSRTEIYQNLAALAQQLDPVRLSSASVMRLLELDASSTDRNAGNAITNDLKYHLKLARHHSVHVSPTVLVDGLPDTAPQSVWTLEQWLQHLKTMLV